VIGRQLHRSGHHLAIQRHVEYFLPVLLPARLRAAAAGDLELPARSGKGLDVDLELARFVRLVRDPLAVRGELAIALLEGALQERKRLFIAGEWQDPQVRNRLRIVVAEEQEASIGGQMVWR